MKVTITFNLPDEQPELRSALVAERLQAALVDVDRELRAHLKHGAVLDPQALRLEIHEVLQASGYYE